MLMVNSAALAQSVEVVGYGDDKEAATKDAMRAAVEQVVGTFLDSKTLVSQSVVVQDEIYSKAQGFVTNINVLEEGKSDYNYFVRARVDVNTNPDSQLQDRLQMIMLLGDPRIGVIVFKSDNGSNYEDGISVQGINYDSVTEKAINAKLLELGFSHLADVNIVSKLRNSSLLNSIYTGDTSIGSEAGNYGIDILVLAKSSTNATQITLMNQDGTTTETQLVRGNANVTGKVIVLDTGYIKGVFDAQGQGVDISSESACNKALNQLSNQVAQRVEKILRGEAAKPFRDIQITATANDISQLEMLITELKRVSNVQNVFVREKNNSQVILDVETGLKVYELLQRLRAHTELGIFNEDISANSAKLSIS